MLDCLDVNQCCVRICSKFWNRCSWNSASRVHRQHVLLMLDTTCRRFACRNIHEASHGDCWCSWLFILTCCKDNIHQSCWYCIQLGRIHRRCLSFVRKHFHPFLETRLCSVYMFHERSWLLSNNYSFTPNRCCFGVGSDICFDSFRDKSKWLCSWFLFLLRN